ncbi:DUF7343 domain-containing protein [Candidatus Pyrohabitans sp.]
MRPLAAALLLLLLLARVEAVEITNYRASLEIEDGLARGEVTLSLLNDQNISIVEFRYPLFGRLEELEVTGDGKTLEFQVEQRGERSYVITPLPEPLEYGESYEITYRYLLRNAVEKHENIYILSVTHSLFANVKKFEFTVALPPGYGVVENGVSPESTPTSDGRRVILKWELHEPIPPELKDFRVIVIYENLFEARNYVYIALLMIAGVVILFLSYKYLKVRGISIGLLLDRKKRLEEKIEILKEDEQQIMKIIIENDGIDQRDIVRITGFSKTKVSKILSELEKRGAIRKVQVGRRNKIYLAKNK